jgi:hypothetical protein
MDLNLETPDTDVILARSVFARGWRELEFSKDTIEIFVVDDGGNVIIKSTGSGTGPLAGLNQAGRPGVFKGVNVQILVDMGFPYGPLPPVIPGPI